MRFRTLVVTVLFLGAIVWGAYTIVYASSSYLEAAGVVERAFTDAAHRRKTAIDTGIPVGNREFMANVRAGVMSAAKRVGLTLDEDGVEVVEVPGGLRITMKWSFPVLTYDGYAYLAIPMSVTRSVSL